MTMPPELNPRRARAMGKDRGIGCAAPRCWGSPPGTWEKTAGLYRPNVGVEGAALEREEGGAVPE